VEDEVLEQAAALPDQVLGQPAREMALAVAGRAGQHDLAAARERGARLDQQRRLGGWRRRGRARRRSGAGRLRRGGRGRRGVLRGSGGLGSVRLALRGAGGLARLALDLDHLGRRLAGRLGDRLLRRGLLRRRRLDFA